MDQAGLQHAALDAFRARHGSHAAVLKARLPVAVLRLDRPGGYVLVGIDDEHGLHGLVALTVDGAVESSALVRNPATVFLSDPSEARAAAEQAFPDRRGWQVPFLGWRPCRESFDSLRPLWVVPHAEGEVFVTQDLAVSQTLTSGRGG